MRRLKKDFNIEPDGPSPGVSNIQADHIVKFDAAAPVNLPESGDAGLRFQYSISVPDVVLIDFVLNWRPGTNQRHLSAEHVDELRKLVEACPSQERAYSSHSRIALDLVYAVAIAV